LENRAAREADMKKPRPIPRYARPPTPVENPYVVENSPEPEILTPGKLSKTSKTILTRERGEEEVINSIHSATNSIS
jgi:hypothetical protein